MDLLPQFGGIALTLALLAGALWWLRRKGLARWNHSSGRVLDVIESRTLAPGHTLHLVRVGDRAMALTTHGGGCTLLEARPWNEVRQNGASETRP